MPGGAGKAVPDVGRLLQHYRKANGLTQFALADLLHVDQSYVSRLERGGRVGRDIVLRKRIVECLDLPPHALGLAPEHYTTGHSAEVLELAPGVIRLAAVAREGGRSEVAAYELQALLVRLEAHAVQDNRNAQLLLALAGTWAALGIALGDVLPEGHLPLAAQYLDGAWMIAKDSDDGRLRNEILRRHGNELRKLGRYREAAAKLEEAYLSADAEARGIIAAARARLYGLTHKIDHFRKAVADMRRALGAAHGCNPAFNPTVVQEVELRGFVDLGSGSDIPRLVKEGPGSAARWLVTAQWRILASITRAHGLLSVGSVDRGVEELRIGLSEGRLCMLPRQVQRGISLAASMGCGGKIGPELAAAYDFLVAMQRDPSRWSVPALRPGLALPASAG